MAAQTYYILHKGGRVTTVAGVVSETTPDEEIHDTSNYRDILGAVEMIKSWGATVAIPFATGGAPEGADDRLNHVAPRNEMKKRTRLMLWSGAGGTGDVLFAGWLDRIESYSIATYTRV